MGPKVNGLEYEVTARFGTSLFDMGPKVSLPSDVVLFVLGPVYLTRVQKFVRNTSKSK